MAHEIFLSYAKEDRNVADAVCARLEARGIRCWYAPRNVLPGAQWAASIVDAIAAARVMVVVFSSHSNGSPHVRNEIERAVGKNLHIIPFRIEDVPPSKDIELFVSSPHWLDALTPPIERHIEQLADTIQVVLSLGAPPPAAGGPLPPPPATRGGRRAPRAAVALLAAILLAGAGAAAFFATRGPSSAALAHAFAEADRLHAETRALEAGDHQGIQARLAEADSLRERARAEERGGARSAAVRLAGESAAAYRAVLAAHRAALDAQQRRRAVEDAVRADSWVSHPAVESPLREARELAADANAAYGRGEFERATEAYDASRTRVARAAASNAEARAALEARDAYAKAAGALPASSLPPVAIERAAVDATAKEAAARYDAGSFVEAARLWETAGARVAELRKLAQSAVPLESKRDALRARMALPGGRWYAKLARDAEALTAELASTEKLLDRAETWRAAQEQLDSLVPRVAELRKLHDDAWRVAMQRIESVPAIGEAAARRHAARAERVAAFVAAARSKLGAGDFDEVAADVQSALDELEAVTRADDAERARVDALVGGCEKALAELPAPLYSAVAGRRDTCGARLKSARAALAESDFAKAVEEAERIRGEIEALRREHEAARGVAERERGAWVTLVGRLSGGPAVPKEAEEGAREGDAALRRAEFDQAAALYRRARASVEPVLAEWERTKALAPGSEWTGEVRRASDGMFLATITLLVKTRSGDAIDGWITVKGRSVNANQSFAGSVNGTQVVIRLVKNQRGEKSGQLLGTLEGTSLRGPYGVGGGNMEFAVTRKE